MEQFEPVSVFWFLMGAFSMIALAGLIAEVLVLRHALQKRRQ